MRIECRNIVKQFDRAEARPALSLSLLIPSSQFLVVIGPNGSGKTTLLNILSGSVVPESGKVLFDNEDAAEAEHVRSRKVARVFQDPLRGTAPAMTILENFRLASLRSRPKKLVYGMHAVFRKQVSDKVATLGLGLENRLDQETGLLSGGQRQALSLLMATMDRPGILLLDEPSAALDPHASSVIMGLAGRIIAESGLTAILVTHNMKDALKYGNRLICLKEGRIAEDVASEDKMKLQTQDLHRWFDV